MFERAIKDIEAESSKYFDEALKRNDMSLVFNDKTLKRSFEESKKDLKLEKIQRDLEQKKRKLYLFFLLDFMFRFPTFIFNSVSQCYHPGS